jgi:hypothetical protein
MEAFLKKVVFTASLSVLFASGWALAEQTPQKPGVKPEQQKRCELMKSKGPEASLTILPVRVSIPREFRDRVSIIVGILFEQRGLKNIELGQSDFDPGNTNSMESIAASLGEFVRKSPIASEYALYTEYHGDSQRTIDALRAIVVDKAGEVVWTDRLTPQDEAFQKVGDPDAMGFSGLLAERLSPQLNLNEETAKAAKPGKMAALAVELFGMPLEDERTPLPGRQKEMKEAKPKASLMVFPVRIGGKTVDEASAANLAKMINATGLYRAVAAKQSVSLKASNEWDALCGLARAFRGYAKKNPAEADYVLYADYVFNPQNWEQGFVHFVVCDRKGEWVIVDLQNLHQPDYQSIRPTSREACDRLLVKRLEGYLR